MLRKSQGFTLLEVIVSIVIMGIIILGITNMIWHAHQVYKLNRDQSASLADANMAMSLMMREIRQATSVTRDSATQLTIAYSGKTIVYSLSGSNLTRKEGTNNPDILSQNVTTFTVTQSVNNFAIDLTVNNQGKVIALKDSVTPRNTSGTL